MEENKDLNGEKFGFVYPKEVFDEKIREIASLVFEPASKAYTMAFVPFVLLPKRQKENFVEYVKKWKIGIYGLSRDFFENYVLPEKEKVGYVLPEEKIVTDERKMRELFSAIGEK